MKKLIIYIAFNLCIIPGIGQGIIIDHASTNFEEIPVSVIDDIKDNIKWQYSGTSHSGQLLCGITQIEDSNPVYNVEIGGEYYCCFANVWDPPYLPNIPDALCIYPGNCGYRISNTGYYKNPSCVQQTLNQNPTINISQWCWCSELDSYTEAQVQEYLDAVNLLEQQNPNVIFIYMTGNAQAGGAPGYNRHLRNNQIRQYCINNNKVLYDFADLDCWHDGEQSTYLYNGENIPIQHPAFDGSECHHSTYLSALQKGKAVWMLMAKLRGYGGNLTIGNKISVMQMFCNLNPNPAKSYINFEVKNIEDELVIISIIDLRGEVIIRQDCIGLDGSLLKRIDIEHLCKGLYIVNIQCGEKMLFEKFIKL